MNAAPRSTESAAWRARAMTHRREITVELTSVAASVPRVYDCQRGQPAAAALAASVAAYEPELVAKVLTNIS